MKILAVHGLGRQELEPSTWQPGWTEAFQAVITPWRGTTIDVRFAEYDQLFADTPMTVGGTVEGFGRLLWDEVKYSFADALSGLWDFRRRAVGDQAAELVKWKIGMITQFAEDEKLRAKLRASLSSQIREYAPDVVFAHSLGSLIVYDLLLNPPLNGLIADRYFVTAGCQIGRAALRTLFGGRLRPVVAHMWYNLYNPHDDVLVVPLRINASNYLQVETAFELEGIGDHDGVSYIRHPNARNKVWREIAGREKPKMLSLRGAAAKPVKQDIVESKMTARVTTHQARRALLVGINDYPNTDDRLEGCVNDVFRMSATLQQIGFEPEEIRVVLNERATAAGIRERFEWLLDDPRAGDTRVFYFSGHGAQIPDYGSEETVDHTDETLVPYDFDWSKPSTHLTDDEFNVLYAQLPYDTAFVGFFDCCHSGGIARAGGAKIRGLNPPDDIRHRMLRWNWQEEVWEPRDLARERAKNRVEPYVACEPAYTGANGVTNRLFRGVPLRQTSWKEFLATRSRLDHQGPYLPLIFEACAENQFAYEYRDGVTSYGAYTYFLTQELFRAGHTRTKVTFNELNERVQGRLANYFDQKPQLLGNKEWRSQAVPWRSVAPRAKPRRA